MIKEALGGLQEDRCNNASALLCFLGFGTVDGDGGCFKGCKKRREDVRVKSFG
jgi:hypothetical protein